MPSLCLSNDALEDVLHARIKTSQQDIRGCCSSTLLQIFGICSEIKKPLMFFVFFNGTTKSRLHFSKMEIKKN